MPTETDVCERAMRAAFDKGMELCGSKEQQLQQMRPLFGLGSPSPNDEGDGVEPDIDCEHALEEGLNRETLNSPNGTRQWVMCKAHELINSESRVTFQDALQQAWAEADRAKADMEQ